MFLLYPFSNLLKIHQVKTEKIATVKEVWIPGLNQQRFWRFYSLVFVSLEKIYQTPGTVFHRLSKHLEFRQKYSAARCIFNSLLGVWISRRNTVPRVWYNTSTIFQNVCVAFISPTEDLKSSFTEPTIFTKTNTAATLPRTLAKPEGRTIQKIFCLLQNGKTTFSLSQPQGEQCFLTTMYWLVA